MQILTPLFVCRYLWSSGKLVQHITAQMAFIREHRMSASILYKIPDVDGTMVPLYLLSMSAHHGKP